MRYRATSLILVVCLAFASLAVAGCGSSKKHSTAKKAAIAAGAAAIIVHHHHKKVAEKKAAAAAASGNYRAGEYCSTKKESTYKSAGFKCVKVHGTYRLEKA